MKTINQLCLLALVLLLASCSSDDEWNNTPEAPQTNGGDIEFEIGFAPQGMTRVATDINFKSTWETGDEIGVFAVKRASTNTTATLQATDNYIKNVKLTLGSDGKWTGAAYYPNDGEVLDFYAYYPYNDNAGNPQMLDPTNMTFDVKLDQSAQTDFSKSDLLTGSTTGIAKNDVVTLTFDHKLAMMQVTLDNKVGAIDPNEELIVKLRNIKTASTLNLSTNSVAISGNATEVKMYRVEQPGDPDYRSNFTFRGIVPVQTVAQDISICRIYNGNLLLDGSKLTANVNLLANRAGKFTQALPVHIPQIFIPNGTFQMGSTTSEPNHQNDETQHTVELTKDFYMSKYQITNAQYAAFLNVKGVGSDGKLGGSGDIFVIANSMGVQYNTTSTKWNPASGKDNFPVIYVTWYGAEAYATSWVGGSLPTEAQWEYACRAGTSTAYSYGNTFDGDYMWYSGNNATNGSIYGTKEVGQKLSNPWGLYDMHGNVWEWCADWYGDGYYNDASARNDPTGPTTGNNRVLRGGSWNFSAQSCRSAYRNNFYPGDANLNGGFRVVFVP